MATDNDTVQLNEADIAYLITLLRDAQGPLTTAELVEALKNRNA
jgi:hypothetical protein